MGIALKKRLSGRSEIAARLMQFGRAAIERRIVRDGAWVAGGQIMSAVAALVSIRIMTELLSPDEFGQLTLLVGAAALALGIAANPRLQAVVRYYPEAARAGRIDILRATAVRLIAPLVALVAMILVLGWLAWGAWFGGAWFTGLLVAALLVVDCLRSLELSLLNAARRQREASLIYAADAWSRPLLAIAVIFAVGSSTDAALAGYIAGSAAVVLGMRLWLRLEGAIDSDADMRVEGELASSIRHYAWPLAPLAVFGWLSGMGDRYVIAGLLSLHDAGLYAAACGLASRPFLMLGGIVELTMRPVLQNTVTAGDATLIARAKMTWLLVMVTGAAFGVVCFVLLSEWVGRLLLAEEYRSAIALMPWIALGYALYNIATVYTRFCYAFDDTKAVSLIVVCGTLLGVAVMVPAIYFWKLPGAGYSVPVGFCAQLLLAFVLASRAETNFVRRAPSAGGLHHREA